MNDKQQKFILMRADGKSFDVIAKDLQVSKPTLIQWSKLYQKEIKELQFEAFIKIKEAYSFTSKSRYEKILQQLDKIEDYILEADLSNTSIKDLFVIKNSLVAQLERIEKNTKGNPNLNQKNILGELEPLEIQLNEID